MDNNEPIMVSIKCLVYNHAPYLRQCLDGFVMQKTNFRFEAIVHDDCSTDGSQEIIKEYAAKYPNIIKPIYETENQYSKHDGSLRRAIDPHLTGKYIAFCEGDDYWIDPNKLQKQITFLEQNPDFSMCHTGFINVDENGNTIQRIKYESLMKQSCSGDILLNLLTGNFILTCTTCMRKDVSASEIYQNAPFHYDYSMFLSASILGKIKYFPEKTAAYRKTPTGAMATQGDLIGTMFLKSQIYFFNGIISGRFIKDKHRNTRKIKTTIIKACLYNDSEFKQEFRDILWKNKNIWPYLPWFCFKRAIVQIARKTKVLK
jgi:glycosyltransferase involved in cell wall biosynthesis